LPNTIRFAASFIFADESTIHGLLPPSSSMAVLHPVSERIIKSPRKEY